MLAKSIETVCFEYLNAAACGGFGRVHAAIELLKHDMAKADKSDPLIKVADTLIEVLNNGEEPHEIVFATLDKLEDAQ